LKTTGVQTACTGTLTGASWAMWYGSTSVKANWTCTAGSVTTVITKSYIYVYGQDFPTLTAPDCSAILDGSHRERLTVTSQPNGAGAVETIADHRVWSTTSETTYPLCTKSAPVDGCTMRLYKGTTLCVAVGLTAYPSTCNGWWTVDGTSGYSCKWGTPANPQLYSLPLADCQAVIHDGQLDTASGPDPDPITDPATDRGTGTSNFPGTGTNNPPLVDGPAVDTTDATGASCMGGAWSWNPVNWIYIPIKCALQWALVPTAETQVQLDALSARASSSIPFSYVGDIVTWFGTFTGVSATSGCYSITLPLGSFIGDVPVFSTCSGLGAILEDHRGILSVAIYASFVLPLVWWAWRAYAPGSTGVA
jgi:hypothetical protein